MNWLPTLDRILKKPPVFVIVPVVLFLILLVAKWQLNLPYDALWFFLGGMLGIYLIDIVEEFITIKPSPFRSLLFIGGLIIVNFYLVVSTREFVARGLAISLLLSLFISYVKEWQEKRTVQSWFTLFIGDVSEKIQKNSVYVFGGLLGSIIILFLLV